MQIHYTNGLELEPRHQLPEMTIVPDYDRSLWGTSRQPAKEKRILPAFVRLHNGDVEALVLY